MLPFADRKLYAEHKLKGGGVPSPEGLQFAGPCAQGVLDPVMIPCPMSLGCAVLFCSIGYFLIRSFLGALDPKSVLLAGYLLATCWLLVGLSLTVANF